MVDIHDNASIEAEEISKLRKKIEAKNNASNEKTNASSKEQDGFRFENLEEDAKEKEHSRSQKLQDLGAWLARILLIILSIIVIIGLILWAYHSFVPSAWTWLNASQIEKIESLGKILLGAILGYYLNYFKIQNKS